MFDEDDYIPISALQHYCYCPRQCALIHMERAWEENQHTAAGQVMHNKTHAPATVMEGGILIARGVRLYSRIFGLTGQADTVEFHPAQTHDKNSVTFPENPGLWSILPVEYKKGKPKKNPADRIQLCAQALCLEEMFGIHIDNGVLFYGKTRRRIEVSLDETLRDNTISIIDKTRSLILAGPDMKLPAPCNDQRCSQCSLANICMPKINRSARNYFENAIHKILEGGE